MKRLNILPENGNKAAETNFVINIVKAGLFSLIAWLIVFIVFFIQMIYRGSFGNGLHEKGISLHKKDTVKVTGYQKAFINSTSGN